ncbi:dihydrofolate reductase family protein [Salininema proteolyticum]|uniref:Dihydrofolate reductase family protein n=1 Tax=Salininema proteolyticum TaxID=1607685 RepID=A0ABV8TUJ0_9ACTN
MRKIIEQAAITLDGQISTPQNWVGPAWEGEFGKVSQDLLFSCDALLYGRVSFEQHSLIWPGLEDAFGDYAVKMNTVPKHVASSTFTGTDLGWNGSLLEGDVAEAVADLKSGPGGDILKVGSGGPFSRLLMEHRLVDEYRFWLFPVIAGSGGRLFEGIETAAMELVELQRLDSGIVGLTYTLA